MGTANFSCKNTSKYFIIDGAYEDDETGEMVGYESWDWDAEIENIQSALSNHGYEEHPNTKTNDRNSAMYLSEKDTIKCYGDISVTVRLIARIRDGYYQGANLDFNYEILIENGYCEEYEDEMPDLDGIAYLIEDDFTNKGLAKMTAMRIENWIEKTFQEMVDELEGVFETLTTAYVCSGRFSTGEAVYTKI